MSDAYAEDGTEEQFTEPMEDQYSDRSFTQSELDEQESDRSLTLSELDEREAEAPLEAPLAKKILKMAQPVAQAPGPQTLNPKP